MRPENSKKGSPEFGAALRVMGTGLDLPEISRNLDMSPTHSHRNGEVDTLGKPYPHDMWSLQSPLDPAETLDAHLRWLQTALAPHYGALRSLRQRAEVDIYCHATYFREQNGLELSPEVLTLFTELSVPLGISILLLPDEAVD